MRDIEIDLATFLRDGFTTIPSFVLAEEAADMRSICDSLRNLKDANSWMPSTVLEHVPISRAIFSSRSQAVASVLLGKHVTFLPNFTVRRNANTDWHLDSGFAGTLGGVKLRPSFLQCAIYLQDNSTQIGGGIDVIIGSHRRSLFCGQQYVPAEVLHFPQRHIASKAGDLVVWDVRLLHRSTPLFIGQGSPNKYGIHWTLASDTQLIEPFRNHIRARSESEYDRISGEDQRYRAIYQLRYPQDFPQDIESEIESSGISLVRSTT